jgi:DNA-directed RNA polymerase specialized sigma24 family protein
MRRDHERAFDAFVSSTQDRAYRMAYAVTRQEQAASTALREAYAGIYAGWTALRRTGEPEIELRRLLVGRLLAGASTPVVPAPRAPAPDEQVVDCATVWSALAELSVEHRVLLTLRHYDRLSDQEIAQACGVGVEQAQAGLFDAMTALRQLLIAPPRQRQTV